MRPKLFKFFSLLFLAGFAASAILGSWELAAATFAVFIVTAIATSR